jgi:hypothetical protein
MKHVLTISGLDDEQAQHVNAILNDYVCEMLMKKIEAANCESTVKWVDAHISWHEQILDKVIWSKEEE